MLCDMLAAGVRTLRAYVARTASAHMLRAALHLTSIFALCVPAASQPQLLGSDPRSEEGVSEVGAVTGAAVVQDPGDALHVVVQDAPSHLPPRAAGALRLAAPPRVAG